MASLDPHQTGFRPQMSTCNSLIIIYDAVLVPTGTSGDPCILVAIDVKELSISFIMHPSSKVPIEDV